MSKNKLCFLFNFPFFVFFSLFLKFPLCFSAKYAIIEKKLFGTAIND